MKVDNVKPLNTNSTVPNTQHIARDGATAATRPAMNNTSTQATTPRQPDTAQIMQQHAQISRQQTGNAATNPNGIYNLFRQRRLGDRSLSNPDNNSVPAMDPKVMEEVFGLLNGIKTAKQVSVYTRKFFKRIGHKHNIIDSNHDVEDDDDKQEAQDVKRKTTSKVDKEDVRNSLEEMIGKDPTNAYIIIESAKRELGLTGANSKNSKDYTDIDKAVIEFAKENYETHGVRIRADINIANEVGQSQNKTQFKELYYAIILHPQLTQLMDIHKVFVKNDKDINVAHNQFMEATNLLSSAAKNDRDGEQKGRLPASDPNTIHDAIAVMDKRSKINSLFYDMKKLKKGFSAFISNLNGNKEEPNKQLTGVLSDYLTNQRMKANYKK
jgi:hypothetical protein